jgi:hypothetical protein
MNQNEFSPVSEEWEDRALVKLKFTELITRTIGNGQAAEISFHGGRALSEESRRFAREQIEKQEDRSGLWDELVSSWPNPRAILEVLSDWLHPAERKGAAKFDLMRLNSIKSQLKYTQADILILDKRVDEPTVTYEPEGDQTQAAAKFFQIATANIYVANGKNFVNMERNDEEAVFNQAGNALLLSLPQVDDLITGDQRPVMIDRKKLLTQIPQPGMGLVATLRGGVWYVDGLYPGEGFSLTDKLMVKKIVETERMKSIYQTIKRMIEA